MPDWLDKIGAAATDAVTGGLRRHGPDIVGFFLFGVTALALAVLSLLLLGVPAWVAGLELTGATGLAAAWKHFRNPQR